MAERSVVIRLQGQITDFQAKMKQAKASVSDVTTEMGKATKRGEELRRSFGTVADAGGKIGLAAAAGLAVATKAAMDWESAFAGVRKTVNETATMGYAELEEDLRGLARTLPATHAEIAGVAEAAGQLGIAADDVTDFTQVMIDLGETTNLTAEEAATGIARFSNVMQLSASDVDKVGSALVELGNNSETTEAEILEISQRMAAAGQIAGLSASDVLGFGATLTSVGVNAEAGGTALSKVFTAVRDAAIDGGDKLEVFASTAGVTAEEFTRAFQEDAAGAVEMFIGGLGRMNESGQSTTAVFNELKLTDERLKLALNSTASAQDHLSDRLKMGADAWSANEALAIEAAARYETSAAQMRVSVNNIKDAMIDFGEVALPILAGAADKVAGFAQAVGSLPGPVKTAGTSLLGITAVLGGGLWFTSKTINGVIQMRDAVKTLGGNSDKASRALGGLGKAAGAVSLVFAGFAIADSISRIGDEDLAGLEELTGQLIDLSKAGAAASLSEEFDSLDESVDRLTSKNWSQRINDSIAGTIGFGAGRSFREAEAEIDALDAALANLVTSGNADVAADALANLNLSADELADLKTILPGYDEALAGLENDAELAADGIEDIGSAAGDAAGEVDGFSDALENLEGILEGRSEMRDYQQSVIDFNDRLGERKDLLGELKDAQKELNDAENAEDRQAARERIADIKDELEDYALTLDTSTQAGIDWQEMLDDMALSAVTAAENLDGLDRKRYLRKARRDFIEARIALGQTREEARLAWDDLVALDEIDPTITIDVKFNIEKAPKITGPDGATYDLHVSDESGTGGRFASGGYTGDGGKYEPKGVVHGGEYVFSAEATRGNLAYLDTLHRSLRGYADGGPVATRPAPTQPFDPAAVMQQLAARSAPLIGSQTVLARDTDDWLRQTEAMRRLEATGGADFT